MSLCVVATDFGGPEVLAVVDEEVDVPATGQVSIEVRAAGVNPADLKAYAGTFSKDPAQLPMRLGYEVAGVVTATGSNAIGPTGPLAVGDEVIAFRVSGGYTEQIVVPATVVLHRSQKLDWAQSAGLMLTGATAFHMLEATGVSSGDTVLLHAAAGGVGLMAVQLIVARGARVIGTASPSQHELIRSLGAEPVAYGPGLQERVQELAPNGVDAALDAIGNDEALDVSLALVANRDRIATIAGNGFTRGPKEGMKVLGGGPGADAGTKIREAARLELLHLVDSDQLTVRVEKTFPMSDVIAAHQLVASGHVHGKVVLIP